MLRADLDKNGRKNKQVDITAQFTIVGGGMAGVCSAIQAARSGVKVCLVQDRPVLGGCGSSEIRVWILGATSHLGNNNRWSREGGVIDEILIENLHRNKEGNAVIFDTILLDKVKAEKNITLLLNTSVYQATKSNESTIKSINAFCSQTSIEYNIQSDYFCDASGDGVLGFMAGAPFVIGAEAESEFGEKMAPKQEQTELLGHTLFFYSKDAGKPVDFTSPDYAKNTQISKERLGRINKGEDGVRLWWIEYGGTNDTIHGTEQIKWELWSVVYTIWDHIKNSGKFEDVENLTLEWVGTIPGKRESRRFIGHSMLTQKDIVEQRRHDTAISYGGWAIDLHPSEGVYSEESPCLQYHSKGIYQIPLGCFISKGIDNLFFAGRIISASHIAFGSTRVMATSAHGGQAVGAAAAKCITQGISPNQLLQVEYVSELQNELNSVGHFIPHVPLTQQNNLATSAQISASSELSLQQLPPNKLFKPLTISSAQLLPLAKGISHTISLKVNAKKDTLLVSQLRVSDKRENYTPNVILEEIKTPLIAGEQVVELPFSQATEYDQYGFICFLKNDDIDIEYSDQRITGIVSAFNGKNKAVSNNGKQVVEGDFGIDAFEFWTPARRPEGHNIALTISPPINDFSASNVINGYTRPWCSSNAWVASSNDNSPTLSLKWQENKEITHITLHFDNDFDHPLESTLMGHPENRMPFCIEAYEVLDGNGRSVYKQEANHQTVNQIALDNPLVTDELTIKFEQHNSDVPVALFSIDIR